MGLLRGSNKIECVCICVSHFTHFLSYSKCSKYIFSCLNLLNCFLVPYYSLSTDICDNCKRLGIKSILVIVP